MDIHVITTTGRDKEERELYHTTTYMYVLLLLLLLFGQNTFQMVAVSTLIRRARN